MAVDDRNDSVAVIIGSQVGAKVMKEKMKAKWIKQMFAVVLLGVSGKAVVENLPITGTERWIPWAQ
jgi:hypothetical protein